MHKKAGGYLYDFIIVAILFTALVFVAIGMFGLFNGIFIILLAVGLNIFIWIIILFVQIAISLVKEFKR